MKTVGAYELKTHLARILDDVGRGEHIQITRNGVPCAELGPISSNVGMTGEEWIQAFRELRKGQTLRGLSARELIDEGRKH